MNLRRPPRTPACPRTRFRFRFAALLLSVVGCASVVVSPPAQIPARRWDDGEIIQALTRRAEQFTTLRTLARVDYSGPEGKNGFEEAVVAQRPDRLRLETLTMLGAVLIVTVNANEIIGYYPREGALVRGNRSKENLVRFTQIPLELHEITALLLGLPPVDLRSPSQQNGNSLAFTASLGGKDIVRFETSEPVPTQWERLDAGGAVELSAKFSEYAETPLGRFPYKILVESATPKRRLEIRYQEPELNSALAPELFFQHTPMNVKEYPIEALGR